MIRVSELSTRIGMCITGILYASFVLALTIPQREGHEYSVKHTVSSRR